MKATELSGKEFNVPKFKENKTLAGEPLYDLSASLASPTRVSELELITILKLLTDHFGTRPSEITAFYHFHTITLQHCAHWHGIVILFRMSRDHFVFCHSCGVKGHLQRVCRSAGSPRDNTLTYVRLVKDSRKFYYVLQNLYCAFVKINVTFVNHLLNINAF